MDDNTRMIVTALNSISSALSCIAYGIFALAVVHFFKAFK